MSSEEAALRPETMSSSKKPTGHESLCTNTQIWSTIDEDPSQTGLAKSATTADIYKVPSQPELTKYASKVDKPVTCDVNMQANKAAKKARQRATK